MIPITLKDKVIEENLQILRSAGPRFTRLMPRYYFELKIKYIPTMINTTVLTFLRWSA